MLCEICWRMLRGQVGRQWRGTYDLHFDHHNSIETLKTSYGMGCGICRVLYEELMASAEKDLGPDYESAEEQPPDQLGNDRSETGLSAQSTALLGVIHDIEYDDVFRLDFKVEWALRDQTTNTVKRTSIVKRTFVLNQTGMWPRMRL